MSDKLRKSALWYAKHGWSIFPLRPRTKEPFASLGVYSATNDTGQVAQWWQRWPQANIGLHCGGCGLVGLDLDVYKDTFAGDGLLCRADEETVTNLTGGGGTHLLYAAKDGERFTNQRGNLPPGIDIKAWGGYLVLPPSIHPSGNPYHWELGYGPHEIEALPLPYSLRSILEETRSRQRVVGPPDSYAVQISTKLVDSILKRLDLATYGAQAYDGDGRKWILQHCPFCPETNPHPQDRAAFVLVARDGHISAGCHHERCRETLKEMKMAGWSYLVKEHQHAYA